MTEDYSELSEFFKIFGDNTRLKILKCIKNGELCVGGIADKLGLASSTVSHQLRILRDKRLVTVRRDGKSAYYSLNDDHIRKIFEMGEEHLKERSYE